MYDDLWTLAVSCWVDNPDARPTVDTLADEVRI
jgi:hypothetical protein